ncbi:hypothetical protein SGFS_072390 [Streptomyces graminofaciens]|uniref:Integral membrane protein n=1 Tax=Streptomyces graminofaciens TaxID=68212 RepID=A0ABM7FH95_9ACTN|nr:hypothetical protein SGFS_072390 [Streptomyces graminofaciens]
MVLGVVLCAPVVNMARGSADGGMDNAIVVRAARTWLAGGSPYDDPHFLYLPSAVLAAVPEAVLPVEALRLVVPAVVTSLLVVGWAAALRVHGVPWRSRFAVVGLVGLAMGFAPFGHLVRLGNWTAVAAAALPLGLLAVVRGRWGAAGLVFGAAVALKPLLAPMALLFVFARRWRELGVMVGVPVVASGGAALVMPDPVGFFTRTLPFLARGEDRFVRLYEASPGAVLMRVGVPEGVAVGVGVVGASVGVGCAFLRWRRGGEDGGVGAEGARVGETGALVMLSAFLVSRPSYDHYLLVVVPVLVAGVLRVGGVARSPWFWVGMVPQVPGFTWPFLEVATRRAFRDALSLCVVGGGAAWWVVARRRVSPPQSLPVPSPGAAAPSAPPRPRARG